MFAHSNRKFVQAALFAVAIALTATACVGGAPSEPSVTGAVPSSTADADWAKVRDAQDRLVAELEAKNLLAHEARLKSVPVLTEQYQARLSAEIAALGAVEWNRKIETVITFYCSEQQSEQYLQDLARKGKLTGYKRKTGGTPDTRAGHAEALQAAAASEYKRYWQASESQYWPVEFTVAAKKYHCALYDVDHRYILRAVE